MRRILPSCIALLALGFSLAACASPPPPGHAGLDTGVHKTGAAGTPLSGGAAVVGTRPSGTL